MDGVVLIQCANSGDYTLKTQGEMIGKLKEKRIDYSGIEMDKNGEKSCESCCIIKE